MRTKLKELQSIYTEAFSGDLYKDVNISISINDKKVGIKNGALTIKLSHDDKVVETTLYIVERDKTTVTLFVNDISHDIIFNKISIDSVSKAKQYVEKYIERSTKRLLGMEIS